LLGALAMQLSRLARQVAGGRVIAVAFQPIDARAAATIYEGVFCE